VAPGHALGVRLASVRRLVVGVDLQRQQVGVLLKEVVVLRHVVVRVIHWLARPRHAGHVCDRLHARQRQERLRLLQLLRLLGVVLHGHAGRVVVERRDHLLHLRLRLEVRLELLVGIRRRRRRRALRPDRLLRRVGWRRAAQRWVRALTGVKVRCRHRCLRAFANRSAGPCKSKNVDLVDDLT